MISAAAMSFPRCYWWRLFKLAFVSLVLISIYLFFHNNTPENSIVHIQSITSKSILRESVRHPFAHLLPSHTSNSKKCTQPKLSLKHDALAFAFETIEPLDCTGSNFFYIKEGMLFPNATAIGNTKMSNCQVCAIRRDTDENSVFVTLFDIFPDNKTGVHIQDDFIYIRCHILEEMNEDGDINANGEVGPKNIDRESIQMAIGQNNESEQEISIGKDTNIVENQTTVSLSDNSRFPNIINRNASIRSEFGIRSLGKKNQDLPYKFLSIVNGSNLSVAHLVNRRETALRSNDSFVSYSDGSKGKVSTKLLKNEMRHSKYSIHSGHKGKTVNHQTEVELKSTHFDETKSPVYMSDDSKKQNFSESDGRKYGSERTISTGGKHQNSRNTSIKYNENFSLMGTREDPDFTVKVPHHHFENTTGFHKSNARAQRMRQDHSEILDNQLLLRKDHRHTRGILSVKDADNGDSNDEISANDLHETYPEVTTPEYDYHHYRDDDYFVADENDLENWYYTAQEYVYEDTPGCGEAQFLVQVNPKKRVFDRQRKTEKVKVKTLSGLNVLMFGIDSVSHMNFKRKLPLTLNFLDKGLKAVTFKGYNIVGDGTTQAILPIFAGKLQQEIPDILEEHLDGVDFVWKHYQKQGYATLFAEDEPHLGVFNLRLNGFIDQPTDHYMRYFWQARRRPDMMDFCSKQYCTGATPNHQYIFQYLEDFFHKYRNISRFAIGYSTELSHDEINPTQYLDNDLRNFLASLRSKGHLKNTVVVIFADHGSRKGKLRRTLQGKLEERLPFLSIVLPEKFRKEHSKLFSHLKRNAKRLTSPFDLHETLLDFLNLSRAYSHPDTNKRGISFFHPIPDDRTCEQAGIDTHWCTCVHEEPVPVSEPVVKGAASAVVSAINKLTQADRQQCAPLKLNLTHSASLVVPNMELLTFSRTEETGKFEVTYGNATNDMAEFQVVVETDECRGMFEATVQVRVRVSEDSEEDSEESNQPVVVYNVKDWDISRIDTYGTQSACICKTNPNIMKFCCCRAHLKGEKLRSC